MEFTRANLHELTVHHCDHNHDNEHAQYQDEPVSGGAAGGKSEPAATHSPFANLKNLLKPKS
jgi:hypothetical protein